jgi:hypothetical protein
LALLVDDLLSFPIQVFELVFNAIIETSYKSSWNDYRRQLNVILMRVRRDYHEGKISRSQMQELKEKIFKELRLANFILESAPAG